MTITMQLDAIRADVQALAKALSDKLGAHIEARAATDDAGLPVLWLDGLLPDSGRVGLVCVGSGRALQAPYAVCRPGTSHRPRRCASVPHAIRVLADEASTVWRQLDTRPATPSATPLPEPAPLEDLMSQETPKAQRPPGQTYTADGAVGHPVIRAAVIASHEIARTTGTTPEPAMVRAMANAALAVVDILWPHYAKPEDGPEFIEHLLVGTLSGALAAARHRPA